MALSYAHHHASLDTSNLGPPFSLRPTDIRESRCKIGTPTSNGSRMDQATGERSSTMAPKPTDSTHW